MLKVKLGKREVAKKKRQAEEYKGISYDAGRDEPAERFVTSLVRDERGGGGVHLEPIGRCLRVPGDLEGRPARVELVEDAADGVDVDGARVSQGVDAGNVTREHLGRRVVRRRVSPDVREHGEGAVGGGDAHGASHVHQAHVERPVLKLPIDRLLG